jgi:hypothetical protein
MTLEWTRVLWAALAVLLVGALAPGCIGSSEDDSLGRICASPAEGGEYCVSADRSPESAWSEAKAHGSLPIEMWAEWPKAVTLDELVASPEKLGAWFTDMNQVIDHLRLNAQSAESYRASMAGRLGALLRQANDRQKELLAQKPVDAVGNLKRALAQKADVEKGPLVAEIASDKEAMAAVQGIFDKAKKDVAPLEVAFAALAKDFAAYRKTEADETAMYAQLAKEASGAGLDALGGVEQAILAASLEASKKPNDLTFAALKLSAELQQVELALQKALPNDYLLAHGARSPDMTSAAQRSINAMLGYVQQRVKRSDAAATALFANIVLRRQALELLGAAAPARAEAMAARQVKASAAFEVMADARLTALASGKPMNAKLGLPYLASRYDELTSLLQLQPFCNKASASWRGAGCTVLGDKFKAVATEVKTTLPGQITTGIALMRDKGVDGALLDAAQAKLVAGDVKGAVTMYDAALRGAEGT